MKIKIIIVSGLMMAMAVALSNKAFSQQTDTTGTQKIAEELAISKEKAIVLKATLQYKQAEIASILTSTTLRAAEKQSKLKQLLAERHDKLNALLTPREQEKLKILMNSRVAAERQQLDEQLRQKKQDEKSKEAKHL